VQELLTRHKALSAQFLEKNYDRFFERYALLLNSENYVTKRQALKVSFSMLCLLRLLFTCSVFTFALFAFETLV
jgi:hypothetical protein